MPAGPQGVIEPSASAFGKPTANRLAKSGMRVYERQNDFARDGRHE
jgi:hypothetical protein